LASPPSHHPESTPEAFFDEHPENQLFRLKHEELAAKKKLPISGVLPKIGAFGTFGFGFPMIFNPFNKTTGTYYWAGTTLKWEFFKWGSTRREQTLIHLQQLNAKEQQDLFNQRLRGEWLQSRERHQKLAGLLEKDKEVIELYEEVLQIASSQLAQGLITSTAYLEKFNLLKQAQLTRNIHASQQSKMHYRLLFLTGKL
jgi:outer membrane protein TolC